MVKAVLIDAVAAFAREASECCRAEAGHARACDPQHSPQRT